MADETERIVTAIRDDIKQGLSVDARLRNVELKQAEMGATVKGLETALPAMESRLVREIQDSRPKNVSAWAAVAVAALAAVISPILAVLLAHG